MRDNKLNISEIFLLYVRFKQSKCVLLREIKKSYENERLNEESYAYKYIDNENI